MAARAIASGTISFGLVAIPVKLYATQESAKRPRFHMVHKDSGDRVKYKYYSPAADRIVERDDLARGYEFAKGQYVVFSDEEYKALQREATNAVEIQEFVPLEEVDPVYYEKSYYLGPDKGGAKPYRLLVEAMKETGMAAVAKYAARGKDYLVLVRPFQDGLIMQQLYYADEIRDFDEVPIDDAEVKDSELALAVQLVEQISSEEFRPQEYEDEVREQTWALIEQKIAGEEIVAPAEEPPKAQIIDLMEALKASLESEEDEEESRGRKRKGAKRAAAGEDAPEEESEAASGGS